MLSLNRPDVLAVSCTRLGVVMEPDGSPFEAEGVLNPGVVRDREGALLLFPRIVAAGNVSRIGIARMSAHADVQRIGIVLEAETEFERRTVAGGHGCEDARVTYIREIDTFVMTYTAFGPSGARIAIATSPDAYAWTRVGMVQFRDARLNTVDNKDAAFFPEVVLSPAGVRCLAFFHRPMRPETMNGQTPIPIIMALDPDDREATWIAFVPLDAVRRNRANLCFPNETVRVLTVGRSWGRLKNGAGTPPLRTNVGWLSVFHGVDAVDGANGPSLYYSAGIMLNDLTFPHNVIYRSPIPVFVPETRAERVGTVDNVVFPTGIDEIDERTVDVYYGAADAKISRCRLQFS